MNDAMKDAIIDNLAAMLRRMIWQARKEIGDTSMKGLAGAAHQLLKQYGLQGDPLRTIAPDKPDTQTSVIATGEK